MKTILLRKMVIAFWRFHQHQNESSNLPFSQEEPLDITNSVHFVWCFSSSFQGSQKGPNITFTSIHVSNKNVLFRMAAKGKIHGTTIDVFDFSSTCHKLNWWVPWAMALDLSHHFPLDVSHIGPLARKSSLQGSNQQWGPGSPSASPKALNLDWPHTLECFE